MKRSDPTALRRTRRAAALCLALAGGIVAAKAAEPADPGAPADLQPLVAGRDFHAMSDQLAWLIDVAVPDNPSLVAARADWRGRAARVDQAGALPDPMTSYRYFGGQPETRVGPQVQSLELSQRVPWRGKRAFQTRAARLEAGAAASGVRDMERALVAELKRMYFETLYVIEALAVNEDEAELLRRFEQIALTRYSTGQGIQQGVIKLQTQISRLADEAIALSRRQAHLNHGIARLLGDPRLALRVEPTGLTLLDLDLSGLSADPAALGDHSRTRALRERVDADRALARRKELDGMPDVAFGVGYTEVGRRDDAAGLLNPPQGNGDDIWAVGVQLNIPIYRRKVRAGVVEARERLRADERRVAAMEDGLSHEIHGAVLQVEALAQRVRLHQEVIIPQAGESLASAESAYTTGRLETLDLLDAERVLFQARLTSQRLLTDYWIALADLEFALGRPFPDAGPTGGSLP